METASLSQDRLKQQRGTLCDLLSEYTWLRWGSFASQLLILPSATPWCCSTHSSTVFLMTRGRWRTDESHCQLCPVFSVGRWWASVKQNTHTCIHPQLLATNTHQTASMKNTFYVSFGACPWHHPVCSFENRCGFWPCAARCHLPNASQLNANNTQSS